MDDRGATAVRVPSRLLSSCRWVRWKGYRHVLFAQRRRTLTFMALHARISRHMRSAVATADRPVFVDSTGHRARLFRRTGYGLAALASTYVVVLGLSLLGATPFAPGVLLPVPGVSGVSGGPAGPAVPGPGALGQVPPLSGGAPGVGGRMAGDSGFAVGPSALLVPGFTTATGGPPGVLPRLCSGRRRSSVLRCPLLRRDQQPPRDHVSQTHRKRRNHLCHHRTGPRLPMLLRRYRLRTPAPRLVRRCPSPRRQRRCRRRRRPPPKRRPRGRLRAPAASRPPAYRRPRPPDAGQPSPVGRPPIASARCGAQPSAPAVPAPLPHRRSAGPADASPLGASGRGVHHPRLHR